MKIAFFADSYHPYRSGVVVSIETFAAELIRRGHEVLVVAPSYPGIPSGTITDGRQGEKVIRVPAVPAPTHPEFTLPLPYSRFVTRFLYQWQPDLIHVHSPFLLGRLGAFLARRLGVPLVFTYHTLYELYVHYVPFFPGVARHITRRLSTSFCNRCQLVIVPTEIIGCYLRDLGVKSRIENVPTGIPAALFQKTDPLYLRQTFNIPDDTKILLCVCRLGKEKNIPFLFDVLLHLSSLPVKQPFHLILVGGGPEEESLKRLVQQKGLNGIVTFTGALPREKVVDCYAGSDLFVFSSLTETQGLVIAEAKMVGLPAVALKANGISEMITDGEDGFLIDPTGERAVEEFALKVAGLLQNEQMYKRMQQAALANSYRFTSENCAVRLENLYYDLVKKG